MISWNIYMLFYGFYIAKNLFSLILGIKEKWIWIMKYECGHDYEQSEYALWKKKGI